MIVTSLLRTVLTRSVKPFVFNGISDNQAAEKLTYKNEKELGLYVHIPFCTSLCSFCPYCKVLYNETLAQDYLDALLKEIDIVGSELSVIDSMPNQTDTGNDGVQKGFVKKTATSLYFGGGTPALMADGLALIIERLKKYFIITDGIGVELHPADVTPSLLALLKSAGVTMISLGIQTFDNDCLNVLGRKPVDYSAVFSAVKEANFAVVDVDLIFAIPGQTIESLKNDINTAFSLGATQISTYPFIDFTFAHNIQKPLKEHYKKQMLYGIARHCRDMQLDRTSVWTFAKKHTHKYSSITRDSFLGFGVSATSLLSHQFKINTFSIPEYIRRVNQGLLPTSLRLDFSLRQRAVYYLFWSAYGMHINEAKFEQFFNIPLYKLYSLEMKIGMLWGLVSCIESVIENGKKRSIYRLTDKGAYYYHFVEQQYTTAYIDKMWNICRVTPWPQKVVLN